MSQEGTSSHVLHVRENSASEMEALFKVVDPHAAKETNKSIPLRDRNLPASFFQQPGLNSGGVAQNGLETQGFKEVGQVSHLRAHSSPASLQQTLSVAVAPPPTGQQHQRQHSCELLDEPLPPGWGVARTPQGQRYFLNHRLQMTTWQDPRKMQQMQSPNNNNNNSGGSSNSVGSPSPSPQQPASPASGTQTPPVQIDVTKLPLPAGWEQAFTAQGEMYFINHVDKSTSWFHPSLPPQQQRLSMRLPTRQSPASPAQQQQQQQQQQLSPLQQQQQQQLSPAQQPPPQASPQQLSPHSPQQQVAMNEAAGSGSGSLLVVAAGSPGGAAAAGMAAPPSEHHRLHKLKQLQLEKELLMKRQEEINRQEMLIRKGVGMEVGESSSSSSSSSAAEMTTVADPFLGQAGSNTDHSRQESADSGLGGMGSGYSLSRTPDDFLSNMEDMDIQEESSPKMGSSGDFVTMEMTSVGVSGAEEHTMDSEDLVPSLQEDIGSELLKDVETVLNSNKVDNLLTWL